MKITYVIAFLAILLVPTACSDSKEDQLQGTWVLDIDSFKETSEYKDANDISKKGMLNMLESMDMEITFSGNKVISKMKLMGDSKEKSSDFEVTESDGDKLTLKTTVDGKEKLAVATINGDKLLFESEGKKFTMKRK